MTQSASGRASGTLRGIAFRPTDSAAMSEIQECTVLPGRGLDCENRPQGKREVTLLSAESWAETCRELGTDLPWHSRRANFLVEGIDLAATIGKTIAIGEVHIRVHGETRPCGLMDQTYAGLRQALVPQCRGGVFGQVLTGGGVRIDDPVTLTEAAPLSDETPEPGV